jgi:hypothetical protein
MLHLEHFYIKLTIPNIVYLSRVCDRVIKASGDDEGMYVNGLFSGARTSTDNFTAYTNPYLVVSRGGNYTSIFISAVSVS